MPWKTVKRGDKYAVVKADTNRVVPGGTHAKKADADRHRRAIEAGYHGKKSR